MTDKQIIQETKIITDKCLRISLGFLIFAEATLATAIYANADIVWKGAAFIFLIATAIIFTNAARNSWITNKRLKNIEWEERITRIYIQTKLAIEKENSKRVAPSAFNKATRSANEKLAAKWNKNVEEKSVSLSDMLEAIGTAL